MSDVATLGIVVKTQGAKEAARDLDRLTKEGDKAEKRAISLGKAWGIALGAGAAAVIVGGVKAIISNTIEAERVQARLENRVKSLGASSVASVKQIERMADALQGVTTFDDEALKSAATSLLAFNNIKPQNFERALRAATDLAADSGDDLAATAERVGKALNNPVTAARALRDVGIELTASQKGVIKELMATGREAEAQGIVLGELERRYAGAAAAARNTLGGAMTALKVAFGNLLEGEGGISDTTEGLNSFTDTLNSPDVKRGAQAVVSGVLSITGALVGLIAQLGNATAALGEFFAANDKKGLNSLQNKRTDLETQLFGEQRAQRRSWLGPAAVENAPRVVALKAEIAQIDRLIVARQREARQQAAREANAKAKTVVVQRGKGIFANVLGTGETAPLPTGAGGGTSKRKRGGSRGAFASVREMPDFAKDAGEELARLIEQENRATDAFLDMKAALEGPLALEMRNHEKRVEDLNAVAAESPIALAGLSDALALEATRHKEATKEIERQLDPLGQLVDSMQFELETLGKTNAERAVMNELRREGIDIMSAEAQAVLNTARAFEDEAKSRQTQIDLMDDFRSSASNALSDFVTGAKSAKDALKDFFDEMAAQIAKAISDKWMAQLFGQSGTSQTGSAGGGIWDMLGSLFGSFLGGGFSASSGGVTGAQFADVFSSGGAFGYAKGGYTGDGPANEVAGVVHRGEYVIPADQVKRMRQGGGGGGVTQNVTFMVEGRIDRSTQSQVAARAYGAASRASARNR